MFAEAISGMAEGWTIILQGGAFAFLVYIVAVMYPKESRQASDERTSRDKMFNELIRLFVDDSKKEREARDVRFETLFEKLQKHFEERNIAIFTGFKETFSRSDAHFAACVDRIEKAMNRFYAHLEARILCDQEQDPE